MSKLKGLSLFSGIGAFEFGLDYAGVDYEMVNYCEIDEHASKCYSLMHNESEDNNLWDVTNIDIDSLEDIDFIVSGSSCQDVSRNGKEKGANKDSGTRSSLMWIQVDIAKSKKPKYIIWENVKGMVSKNHIHNVEDYIAELDEIGYNTTWKVLNSKDFNVPQNRERVFAISIRKDIDDGSFKFPQKQMLTRTLKEMCDFREKDDISDSFENYYNENIKEDKDFWSHFEDCRVGRTGVKNLGMYSYDQMNRITMIDYDEKVLSPTLSCRGVQNYVIKFYDGNRIYRPSPRMCFRLMGFADEDFDKIKDIGTDSQLWDRAGNSIVVNVAQAIFEELFKDYIK